MPETKDPAPAAIFPNIKSALLPRPAALPSGLESSASKPRAIFSASASLKKTFPSRATSLEILPMPSGFVKNARTPTDSSLRAIALPVGLSGRRNMSGLKDAIFS